MVHTWPRVCPESVYPQFSDWSKQDLLKRAKQIGIKGRSAMNKKQLVNALRNH